MFSVVVDEVVLTETFSRASAVKFKAFWEVASSSKFGISKIGSGKVAEFGGELHPSVEQQDTLPES